PLLPSRRKLDSIGFLPIPEKTKSWQGSLVAFVCGIIWFFSEFTLDIVLIVLGVDSVADVEKKLRQHKEQQEQLEVTHSNNNNNNNNNNDGELVAEECMEEELKTKKTHHFHHHYHHHHHHEIYEGQEASCVEHQPQQQHGGGWDWRRESRKEDESAYDGSEEEGDDVVELDLHDDLLAWKSMERSMEFEGECEALFAVSAALGTAEKEERGAVLSSTGLLAKYLQEEKEDTLQPLAEYRLLPAQDLESKVNGLFVTDMDADADADADVDTEAADEPLSASSSPLSSTSTSCNNLHTDTEEKQQAQARDEFAGNTKVWVQLSVSTKTAEAPTLDDCRTTDTHCFHHKQQQQQCDEDEDGQVSGVSIYTQDSVEQSKDQWSMWGPPLAVESAVESLSDDERIKEAKKKALRYGKKKKAAKKARKASLSDGAGSPVEVDRLSA
ncbi:hypothetical protein BGZ95_003412, partial [Linnemannia exigua]